jgi:hypothetical protein
MKRREKQVQNHGPRAPHGEPEYTKRVALRVTPAQQRKVQRKGGSIWMRKLIDAA